MVAGVLKRAAEEAIGIAGNGDYPPVAVQHVMDAVRNTGYSGPTIYYLVKYPLGHSANVLLVYQRS